MSLTRTECQLLAGIWPGPCSSLSLLNCLSECNPASLQPILIQSPCLPTGRPGGSLRCLCKDFARPVSPRDSLPGKLKTALLAPALSAPFLGPCCVEDVFSDFHKTGFQLGAIYCFLVSPRVCSFGASGIAQRDEGGCHLMSGGEATANPPKVTTPTTRGIQPPKSVLPRLRNPAREQRSARFWQFLFPSPGTKGSSASKAE